MAKKKIIVSYDHLPRGVIPQIEKKYPDGWANHVFKVKGVKDSFFYAILVETEEVDYLVKVKVKKDRKGVESDEDFLPEFDELGESNSNQESGSYSSSTEEPFAESSDAS